MSQTIQHADIATTDAVNAVSADGPATAAPAPRRHTFHKREHLCLKSHIDSLFQAGSTSLSAYPLRMVCRQVPYDEHAPRVQVLVSVAKRHLRHAVDRNRAKRQIREAYRLRKFTLIDALPPLTACHAAFIWLSDRPEPTARVQAQMQRLLQRMAERLGALSVQPKE